MDHKVNDALRGFGPRAAAPGVQPQVSVSIGKVVINIGKKGRRRTRRAVGGDGGSGDSPGPSDGVVNYVSKALNLADFMCPGNALDCIVKTCIKCLVLTGFLPPVPM